MKKNKNQNRKYKTVIKKYDCEFLGTQASFLSLSCFGQGVPVPGERPLLPGHVHPFPVPALYVVVRHLACSSTLSQLYIPYYKSMLSKIL